MAVSLLTEQFKEGTLCDIEGSKAALASLFKYLSKIAGTGAM